MMAPEYLKMVLPITRGKLSLILTYFLKPGQVPQGSMAQHLSLK